MADRFMVAVDTDFNPDRVVYDVVDLKESRYFECSYSSSGAHSRVRGLNDGTSDPDYWRTSWKPMPNG